MKKLIFLVLGFTFLACSEEQKPEEKEDIMAVLKSKNYEAEKYFKTNLVVILSKELSDSSKTIDLQEYKSEAGDFIPAFTSKEKFKESTQGANIGKPIIEVNGFYLLSLFDGTEILKINPSLSDEKIFNASELIEQFKGEIQAVKTKLDVK